MDIEAMPKPDWREKMKAEYAEMVRTDVEHALAREAAEDEQRKEAALEVAETGAGMLRELGVDVEGYEAVKILSDYRAECWAGEYRFIIIERSRDGSVPYCVRVYHRDNPSYQSDLIAIPGSKKTLMEWLGRIDEQYAAEALEAKHEDEPEPQEEPLVFTSTLVDADNDDDYEPQSLFQFRAQTYNIAERAEELSKLASAIADLSVNRDHILYRRLLLTLSDLYAEYGRWIAPNMPAKPIDSDEVPF